MEENKFTEDTVEQAALAWLEGIEYTIKRGAEINPGETGALRSSYSQVILENELKERLTLINPDIPKSALEDAFRKLIQSMSPDLFEDNRLLHKLLTHGIDVEYTRDDGSIEGNKVWVFDYKNLKNNSFIAINQFTILENKNNRRPDIILFINGLPVCVIELKNAADENATISQAYNQLQTYKKEIPSLFRTNALLAISDGISAQIGSLSANKERFMPWRTIDGITIAPKGTAELETMIKGALNPKVLLDLIKNFTTFEDTSGHIVKKVAAYHQYHAVNCAVDCTINASGANGDKRAGVIWHTQGSGKSLSMAFYAGKVIAHPKMENPTLVVLTDRNDLDEQLFRTFSHCNDLLNQTPRQAESREHLKELLSVSAGGVIFTTIQKFAPEKAKGNYPMLSDRRNIIVIADEAHRSQYEMVDGFARHMRDGLPNASFIGFTGTPIELSDKDTYAIFGDNIHTYDIQQAVEDGATVRIYYESRLAKIRIDESMRPHIDEAFEEVTEGEESARKEKLKSKWARLEGLVGSEGRLKLIASDIVEHFENRLEALDGKGMIVCMSRRICVELYRKILELRPKWHSDDNNQGVIKVVMTGSASDTESFQQHIRNKKERDRLADRIRDPNDPLKLVIVRDMWLTGFDAPCLHTMYVDKPMQGHGLMQAIARVNRVFKDKPGGLIVDYIGIADQLRRALSIYTEGDRSETGIPQDEAIAAMLEKYETVKQILHGFDYFKGITGSPTEKLSTITSAMEYVLEQEEGKARFIIQVLGLSKAFALAAASDEARGIRDEVGFFQNIRSAFLKSTTEASKSDEELDTAVRQIISKAVSSTGVIDIFSAAGLKNPDISILSDEFLGEVRGLEKKKLGLEMLRKLLSDEIKTRAEKNVVQSRNFTEMLDVSMKRYQNRLIDTAEVIEELIDLAKEVKKAAEEGAILGLNEDEVAFYDALADNKSAKDVLGDEQLKVIARELVEKVKGSASIDWTIKENIRAKMRVMVKRILRQYGYPPDMQEKATDTVLSQAEVLSAHWSISNAN